MWLVNFQTLLLLLQVAICEADDNSALPTCDSRPPSPLRAEAPVITQSQQFLRRGIDPGVIGSTSVCAYSSWTTWSCPLGSTWTTLAPFAGCRTTAAVEIPMYTGCTNGSVRLGPFDNDTCTGTRGQTSCITGWIYYDDNVTLTNYACWPTWTQGNWYAWREEPSSRLPLATIIAIAVAVPIVVIAAVVAGLWWWRRRRRQRARDAELVLEGLRKSVTSSTRPESEHGVVRDSVVVSSGMDTKELEEQRRASELSTQIAPHESILETLGRCDEEVFDDTSSYHTTESRQARHELQASQLGMGPASKVEDGNEDLNPIQKILHHFRL